MHQVETFHKCQISPAVNFRLLLEECQVETFRQYRYQYQVSRSVSCHLRHPCLVVFPLKVHGRKTSLVSPRKKLGTLTLNSSHH